MVHTGKIFDQAKAALLRHLQSPTPPSQTQESHETWVRRTARTMENQVTQADEVYREAMALESMALITLNKLKSHLGRIAQRRNPEHANYLVHPNANVDEVNWRKRLKDAVGRETET